MTGNRFNSVRQSITHQLKAKGLTVIRRDARRIDGGHKRKWTIARSDGRMDNFEENRAMKTIRLYFPHAIVQSRSISWIVVGWKEVADERQEDGVRRPGGGVAAQHC